MIRNRRVFWGLLALCATTMIAGAAWCRRDDATRRPRHPGRTDGQRPNGTVEVLTYRFHCDSDFRFQMDGSPESASGRVVEGCFDLVVDYSGPEPIEGYRFFQVEGRERSGELSPALEGRILVRAAADGTTREFGYPPSMSGESRLLAQSILLRVLLSVPAQLRDTWETDEEDNTGRYRARYAASHDAAAATVTRRKLSYLRVHGMVSSMPIRVNVDGATTGRLEAETRVWTSIEVDEALRIVGGPAPIRSRAKATVRLISRRPATGEELSSSSTLGAVEWRSPRDAAAIIRERARENLRKTLAGVTVESILDRFGEGDSLADALAELFSVDDEAIADAMARLRKGASSRELTSLFIGALGNAGTPAAQAALRELIQMALLNPEIRDEALFSLTMTLEPDGRSVDFLRDFATREPEGRLKGSAIIGVGAMAFRYRDDAVMSEGLARYLRQWEASAVGSSCIQAYVMALGNAGYRETLDIVSRYAEHADDAVRAHALLALRLVSGGDADRLLLRKLQTDRDERVRGFALEALCYRSPEIENEGIRLALADASPELRKTAVSKLALRAGEDAGAKRLLETVAQQDPSEEIRQIAGQAVQRQSR